MKEVSVSSLRVTVTASSRRFEAPPVDSRIEGPIGQNCTIQSIRQDQIDPYVTPLIEQQSLATDRVYTVVPRDHCARGAFLVISFPARTLLIQKLHILLSIMIS